MSLGDLLFDFADVFISRRLGLAIAAGVIGGIAAYSLLDDSLATRVSVLSIVTGIVLGLVWEYRYRNDAD